MAIERIAQQERNTLHDDLDSFYDLTTGEERIKHLLSRAVTAPSTHNVQPWSIAINSSSCDLRLEPQKRLPMGDVTGRDGYISMGCLVENIDILSKYYGIDCNIDIFPSEDVIANVEFTNLMKTAAPNKGLSETVKSLIYRQNHRGIFEKTAIPDTVLQSLNIINESDNVQLHLITDKTRIHRLAELTAAGLKIAYKNAAFRKEMSLWVNNNLSKRREGIPGYALRFPTPFSLVFPLLVRHRDIGSKVSILNKMSVDSAPLVCIITAKDDTPSNWVEVGRLAERSLINLTKNNIRSSIFVASVEMGELYKEVMQIIGTSDRPQFLFCAGYMKHNQGFTLRQPIEKSLL